MCLFRKRKEKQEEVEQLKVLSVEELFANIELLKAQFIAVRDDVEARDEKIAELEKQLENRDGDMSKKDERINELELRVAELEELLANIDDMVSKK